MEEEKKVLEQLPVLGMPTSVLKYGTIGADTKAVFLVIPGNPGVAEYYDSFMRRLFVQGDRKIPVWAVSHAGHVQPEGVNQALYRQLSYDVCTLTGQIRHKLTFIQDHIPKKVKLFLIGHSIGCYMILKLLNQLERPVGRCFLLFPTIERMALSPNGKVYTPTLKYLRWAAPMVVSVLGFLPRKMLTNILEYKLGSAPPCILSATESLLKPFPVSNALFMANEEMRVVSQLDEDLVKATLNCTSYYFGQQDKWCPQLYYKEMRDKFPEADMRLCSHGYSHAYVIDASIEMADIVSEWVQPYL